MPNRPDAPDDSDRDDRLNRVIAAYLEAAENGQHPRPQRSPRRPPRSGRTAPRLLHRSRRSQHTRRRLDAAPALRERVPHRFGAYELLEEIGRGGMGVVYRARQTMPDRLVALKMILAGARG